MANLFASAAHFMHNAVFLETYPGPSWIPGPWVVVTAWFVVAAVLVRGYSWHRQGEPKRALVAVVAYCISCIFVFGHYLYGPPSDFEVLTNLLILMEGIAGFVLLLYFVGWGRHSIEAMNRTQNG